jgi:hypothetical protein
MLPEALEAAMAKAHSLERSGGQAEIPKRAETKKALSSRLEGLLQQMQTRAAKRATEAAFHASLDELGRAAVEQARTRRAFAGVAGAEHFEGHQDTGAGN